MRDCGALERFGATLFLVLCWFSSHFVSFLCPTPSLPHGPRGCNETLPQGAGGTNILESFGMFWLCFLNLENGV